MTRCRWRMAIRGETVCRMEASVTEVGEGGGDGDTDGRKMAVSCMRRANDGDAELMPRVRGDLIDDLEEDAQSEGGDRCG